MDGRGSNIRTVGCSGLLDARPKFEATTISKLRDAGAILLGKATLTEWANYRNAARASGGWSAVGGQGLAPYHKDQDTSGSSSGSAVAAALGLAAAALGTEVGQSCQLSCQTNHEEFYRLREVSARLLKRLLSSVSSLQWG